MKKKIGAVALSLVMAVSMMACGNSKEDFENDLDIVEDIAEMKFPDFYDYYDKHIGNDLKYYSFMFENNLYKGRSFINILTNSNNTLLPILLDMNDKRFMEFIEQQKKRG